MFATGRGRRDAGQLELVDVVSGEAEQCRQQRDGSNHGHQHGDRNGVPHEGNRMDAHKLETTNGDHHGDPREDHGLASGGNGSPGRLLNRHPAVEMFPVASDDEERVIDPDPETNHGGQGGCRGRDTREFLCHRDQTQPRAEANEGRGQRQAHSDE